MQKAGNFTSKFMPQPIILKISVDLIDKARLFKGQKHIYLDCIAWPVDDDQYGNDFRVVQSISKEERQAGTKGAIIGSGKLMPGREPQQRQQSRPRAPKSGGFATGVPPQDQGFVDEGDDIPF